MTSIFGFVSAFGVISLFVAVVAIYALYLHKELLELRTNVDKWLQKISDILEFDILEDCTDIVDSYNNAVNAYNAYIAKFPGKIMAVLVGFKEEVNYELD